MTKSPEEQFLEIAASDGGRLTDESAGKLEGLLGSLKPGERTEWSPAAHFLRGCFYSDEFWQDGFPTKASCHAEANTQSVIDHFTAFLDSAVQPCSVLTVGEAVLSIPDLEEKVWALFGVEELDVAIPPKCKNGELDLIGIAFDRISLAHYLLDEAELSADTLESGLLNSSSQGWNLSIDLTRLHGWMGWLYFDAGQFVKAAAYLQRCWDGIQQGSDHPKPLTATGQLMSLLDWHRWFGLSDKVLSLNHAIMEISHGEDLTPTGTLDCGCDALLLRLAVSHAAAGDHAKAMEAVDVCVQLSEPFDEQEAVQGGWEFGDNRLVPFPEARLFRGALGLKLSQESVLADLALCNEQTDRLRNEVRAVACLRLLRNPNTSEVECTAFAGLASQISTASPDDRSEIKRLCDSALTELLDGSLVKSGFRSTKAEEAANLLDGLLEADRDE